MQTLISSIAFLSMIVFLTMGILSLKKIISIVFSEQKIDNIIMNMAQKLF